MSSHRPFSKSICKKIRMQCYKAMTVEEQAQNRLAFYTYQSAFPKYQRKLANFGQVWDEKLMATLRDWPEFRNMTRNEAEDAVSTGSDLFVVRPSSVHGYLCATYIQNASFVHVLLKYESGKLCIFCKNPDDEKPVYQGFYKCQKDFRNALK
jgi:hypothetical protein